MEILSKKWLLIFLNALAVFAIGLILLLTPIEVIRSFVFVVGIVIAFMGLLLIFGAFAHLSTNKTAVFWLIQGMFNLLIGGIVLFYPEASFRFLMILSGLWALVIGIYQFSVSFTAINSSVLLRVNGFVVIGLGLVLIFAPELFVGLMIQILGLLLVLIAGVMFYFSFLLYQFKPEKEIEKPTNEIQN
jgi:uncharacterized membrane protein HdeD (DUF308 family)